MPLIKKMLIYEKKVLTNSAKFGLARYWPIRISYKNIRYMNTKLRKRQKGPGHRDFSSLAAYCLPFQIK